MSASSSSSSAFTRFHAALPLHDDWETTLYNGLCFEGRKWYLLVDEGSPKLRVAQYKASAFQRFPLKLRKVASRDDALRDARSNGSCWHAGITYIADLRHAGGPTMGIAHFAKRILRLYGLQRRYQQLDVDRIVYPATSRAHLAHSWPSSMLRLLGHDSPAANVDEATLRRRPCCFEHAVVSSRENTYFVRPPDAEALRQRAYALAGLPAADAPCRRPPVACYFQRAEGAPNGKWEGGPRTVVNRLEVQERMGSLLRQHHPQGEVRIVSANSSHSFVQQVALFGSCDLLVSVHGSHNANVMFMRAGSAFMEVNPHKFYYASYNHLATVASVLFLHSRRNAIALPPNSPLRAKADRFERTFGGYDDVRCQEHNACRSQSRGFPTRVNVTDFDAEFARGVRHVLSRCDGSSTSAAAAAAASEAPPGPTLDAAAAEAAAAAGGAPRSLDPSADGADIERAAERAATLAKLRGVGLTSTARHRCYQAIVLAAVTEEMERRAAPSGAGAVAASTGLTVEDCVVLRRLMAVLPTSAEAGASAALDAVAGRAKAAGVDLADLRRRLAT